MSAMNDKIPLYPRTGTTCCAPTSSKKGEDGSSGNWIDAEQDRDWVVWIEWHQSRQPKIVLQQVMESILGTEMRSMKKPDAVYIPEEEFEALKTLMRTVCTSPVMILSADRSELRVLGVRVGIVEEVWR